MKLIGSYLPSINHDHSDAVLKRVLTTIPEGPSLLKIQKEDKEMMAMTMVCVCLTFGKMHFSLEREIFSH